MNLKEMTLPPLTLGWELEAVHRASIKVPGVEIAHDGSVNGEALEYRIKRDHVFDVPKSLEALKKLVTDKALEVDRSCGFHVHIGFGRKVRKLHDWAQWFVQLAREVELDAFKAVPVSRTDNRYCRSWRVQQEAIGSYQYSPSKFSNRDRYQWVNPVEIFRPGGIRTIEIRLMGDTKRYTYLLSWVSACRLMAMSSWALIFDATRMEKEKRNLKETFRLIRENFVNEDATKKEATEVAVYLATKAGLYLPHGKPLDRILQEEYAARPVRATRGIFSVSTPQGPEWQQTLRAMEEESARVRVTYADEPPPARMGSFQFGDTVRAVTIDEDMGIVQGRYYRVINLHHSMNRVCLAVPAGEWWVDPQHLVLAQRLEREPA